MMKYSYSDVWFQVTFEVFREGFVNVLANAIDCLGDEGEDASEWSETGTNKFYIRYDCL